MSEMDIFEGKEIKINLPKFIDSRALICANSGGGKSYAIRKILEESNEKVLSVVLDIEGEFRTLREKYDFLLIGDEGDVPLNMKSAKLLPEKIIGLEIPTIIDISDLKRNERVKYVKDFLEALMQLRKKEGYWKPCLIILDEAHMLAGQQEKQESTSAIIDLMTRGRKRGYCGVLCTQRISKLHKDAVAEANNILIGRTGLDIDMKRASEILGFTSKQDMLSLRNLNEGEFYVFGTAISKEVTKTKVKEVKTTHPKVGMDLRKEIIPPTQKVKKLLNKLSELPKDEEKRTKELEDYKKEVNDLKRQLKLKEKNISPKIDKASIEKAKKEGWDMAERNYRKHQKDLEEKIKKYERIFSKIKNIIDSNSYEKTIIPKIPPSNPSNEEKQNEKELFLEKQTTNGKLRAGAMKMLNWLAGVYPETLTKQRLATLSGFSVKGGTFQAYISELKREGWIEGKQNLKATEEGIRNSEPQEIPSGEDLLKMWKSKFRAGVGKILHYLYDIYPEKVTKEELGDAVGFESTGGTFQAYISELRRNNLIQINSGGIKISDEFFE